MTNNIFSNPFDVWIVDELNLRYNLDTLDIQAIIWFPVAPFDQYTCAIRFCKRVVSEDFSTNDLVENLSCVGNYLNLILNKKIIVEKVIDTISSFGERYGFIRKWDGLQIAIEHTSLTPVYPINISTFRSSIIGNSLMQYYKKFGAEVTSHYLVADTARNIELVLKNSKELCAQKYSGKTDHICGALFCYALERINKFSNVEYIPKMFPKFKIEELYIETPYFSDVESYCKFCLNGHNETLSVADIHIDRFDYESAVIKSIATESPSYLLNNVAYYTLLSSQYDITYSVISSRQKEIISESLQALEEQYANKVIPIYFNDTVCKTADALNIENELAPDAIRSAVFHSVDAYVESVCLKFNITAKKAFNALKLMILSHNLSSIIVVDYENYSDIERFIHLLDMIESMDDILIHDNEISLRDVALAKNLIVASQIFSMNNRKLISGTKELLTSNIVKYIKSLVDAVYDNGKIYGNLVSCVRQTIQNAMSLLGLAV